MISAKSDGAATAPPKLLLDATISVAKSTKGTHVLVNPDLGLTLYFPKSILGETVPVGRQYQITLKEI